MHTRFFTHSEILEYTLKRVLKEDIHNNLSIGVATTSITIKHMEDLKIQLTDSMKIDSYMDSIDELCTNGKLFFIELTQDSFVESFKDESLFSSVCGKADNPFKLAAKIALFNTESCYWSENVLSEALELYE